MTARTIVLADTSKRLAKLCTVSTRRLSFTRIFSHPGLTCSPRPHTHWAPGWATLTTDPRCPTAYPQRLRTVSNVNAEHTTTSGRASTVSGRSWPLLAGRLGEDRCWASGGPPPIGGQQLQRPSPRQPRRAADAASVADRLDGARARHRALESASCRRRSHRVDDSASPRDGSFSQADRTAMPSSQRSLTDFASSSIPSITAETNCWHSTPYRISDQNQCPGDSNVRVCPKSQRQAPRGPRFQGFGHACPLDAAEGWRFVIGAGSEHRFIPYCEAAAPKPAAGKSRRIQTTRATAKKAPGEKRSQTRKRPGKKGARRRKGQARKGPGE